MATIPYHFEIIFGESEDRTQDDRVGGADSTTALNHSTHPDHDVGVGDDLYLVVSPGVELLLIHQVQLHQFRRHRHVYA